jgi:hypothetical protein
MALELTWSPAQAARLASLEFAAYRANERLKQLQQSAEPAWAIPREEVKRLVQQARQQSPLGTVSRDTTHPSGNPTFTWGKPASPLAKTLEEESHERLLETAAARTESTWRRGLRTPLLPLQTTPKNPDATLQPIFRAETQSPASTPLVPATWRSQELYMQETMERGAVSTGISSGRPGREMAERALIDLEQQRALADIFIEPTYAKLQVMQEQAAAERQRRLTTGLPSKRAAWKLHYSKTDREAARDAALFSS